MKKLIFSLLFATTLLTPLSAHAQQLNEGAATASDIQSQSTGAYFQQNEASQQTDSITNNAGSAVLKGESNQELTVTGAPATTQAETPNRTSKGWFIAIIVIFGILFAPLIYLYQSSKKTKDEGQAEADNVVEQKPETVAVSAKEQKMKASATKAKAATKTKPKKKSASKSKRGKKKK